MPGHIHSVNCTIMDSVRHLVANLLISTTKHLDRTRHLAAEITRNQLNCRVWRPPSGEYWKFSHELRSEAELTCVFRWGGRMIDKYVGDPIFGDSMSQFFFFFFLFSFFRLHPREINCGTAVHYYHFSEKSKATWTEKKTEERTVFSSVLSICTKHACPCISGRLKWSIQSFIMEGR